MPCAAADLAPGRSLQVWQLLFILVVRVRLRGEALSVAAGAVQHWQNYLHQTPAGEGLPWNPHWA